MLDKNLLAILVCPICKGELHYAKTDNELICKVDRYAYPIREGIPVMLENEARELSREQADAY